VPGYRKGGIRNIGKLGNGSTSSSLLRRVVRVKGDSLIKTFQTGETADSTPSWIIEIRKKNIVFVNRGGLDKFCFSSTE